MTTITAKTVLRSRNATAPDKVLSTLLLRYPRWIHAEERTHRLISLTEDLTFNDPTPSLMASSNLSRNAASSRAIPVSKMIQDVLDDPADPLYWGKNISGMQAREELTGEALAAAKAAWEAAKQNALTFARELSHLGVDDNGSVIGAHKQLVNRLLEPFSHITVLVSATEWNNFLELRDHPDAEPHIAILAREIRKCLDRQDDIQTLQSGEWHLPFTDYKNDIALSRTTLLDNIKLSVSRCASTSYKTVDGFDMTLDRAVMLHDKLVEAEPIHASPCEHIAYADVFTHDKYNSDYWDEPEKHRNFVGFCQYRAIL